MMHVLVYAFSGRIKDNIIVFVKVCLTSNSRNHAKQDFVVF
jgi:hypothetical protein